MLAATDEVLRLANSRAGHIFNLGHGVLPNTAIEQVQMLARHVHEASRRTTDSGG
jgi:uroporphyrinogen-III decarboxylase